MGGQRESGAAMTVSVPPILIDENIWVLPYPLKMLGVDLRRNVTVVRLLSGQLLIHSTAPFLAADVAGIRRLGEPAWLLDGVLRHDTFAQEGRNAFPGIPYLAPEGFSELAGVKTHPIVPSPDEWVGELRALEIQGMGNMRDTVVLHETSRTLIVTELLFNFEDEQPLWNEMLLRVAVGGQHHPGMSRPYRHAVKDEAAFLASMRTILEWDFDRIIVGHGDVIEREGKEKLRAALEHAGFEVPGR